MSAEAWGCEGVNQAKTRRDKNSQYRESSTCEVRKTGLVLGARRGDGGGERPRMGDGRPVQLKEARKREAVIEVSQDRSLSKIRSDKTLKFTRMQKAGELSLLKKSHVVATWAGQAVVGTCLLYFIRQLQSW